jgi:hypothetical protein
MIRVYQKSDYFFCAAVGFWYGWVALATVLLLVVLEVTLSFDNAVVNAKVLEKMSPLWRRRFLTWGIVIAVFLTRAVLPIVIVALSAWASPWAIANLALFDPESYALLLEHAEYIIGSFGSMFLLMAGLHYFFDIDKRRHWIRPIERHLATWGSIDAIELVVALVVLTAVGLALPLHTEEILVSGIVGIVLFAVVQGVAKMFSDTASMGSGLALFAYLNVLDAAFSLDSVVGAFALSKEIVIIVIGLGIGAYFVRTLTIYMVEHGTLGELVYLEHGAHWAILGLAAAMIANLFVHIPDPVTGFIGLLFVGAAYISSIRIVEEPLVTH